VAPEAAFSIEIKRACLLVPIGSTGEAAGEGSVVAIGSSTSTFARLRRAAFVIDAEAGAAAFAAIPDFAGISFFSAGLICVAATLTAGAFEPVAFAFIALLLVSTATFAAVHQ